MKAKSCTGTTTVIAGTSDYVTMTGNVCIGIRAEEQAFCHNVFVYSSLWPAQFTHHRSVVRQSALPGPPTYKYSPHPNFRQASEAISPPWFPHIQILPPSKFLTGSPLSSWLHIHIVWPTTGDWWQDTQGKKNNLIWSLVDTPQNKTTSDS